MKQVWLILGKDTRRLLWALLLYWLLLLGGAWWHVRDPWAFDTGSLSSYGQLVEDLIAFAVPLTTTVVIGLLVHLDPLLGPSAYWKTRPIRPLALLGAKAAFVFSYLTLAPSLLDLGVLVHFGLEPARWPGVLASGLLGHAWIVIWVAAVAVVTPGIAVYLLACIVGGFASLLVYSSIDMSGWIATRTPLGEAAAALTMLGVCCVVVWRQYWRRDVRMSAGLLAVGLLLSPLTIQLPWYRLTPSTYGELLDASWSSETSDGYYQVVKTRNQAGTSIRPRMRDAPVSEFLRLKHLWGKVRLDNGQEIIATNSRFATFNDSAALLAALPQYGWFGEPVHEDSQVSLTLHTQLDPAALAGRTVAFEGLAQLQGFAWELAGSLPIEPGARLSNGSLMVEVVNRRPSALDVVLDVRYSGIADAPDPFGVRFQRERVEFLLVRPDRLQVARHFGRESYDPRDDRWRSRSRSIDRASGSVTLKSWSRPYRLPFEKGTDRYEGLELQVWKLVPTQPYRAVINVPEFRTKYQPAQYP